MNHRVLGVGLLLVAVVLAANPLFIYQHPNQVNVVQLGNYYDRPIAANYTYDELSPRARELVRAAIDSPSNATTFHGNDRRPPDFEFSRTGGEEAGGSLVGAGAVYRVEYQGRNYTVETFEEPAMLNDEARRSKMLIGYGLILALVAGLYLWRPQPPDIGFGLGAIGAAFLVVHLAARYAGDAVGGFAALASSVFVLLGIVAAVIGAGYLLFRAMHEREVTEGW
ncbi:MAG: hypothetical protein ABEJ31_12530 [Haloarculaceae archaeon]